MSYKNFEFGLTGLEIMKLMAFFNNCDIDTDKVCVNIMISNPSSRPEGSSLYIMPMIITELSTGIVVDVTDYRENI